MATAATPSGARSLCTRRAPSVKRQRPARTGWRPSVTVPLRRATCPLLTVSTGGSRGTEGEGRGQKSLRAGTRTPGGLNPDLVLAPRKEPMNRIC